MDREPRKAIVPAPEALCGCAQFNEWVYVVSDSQWDFDDDSQNQNNNQQQNQKNGLRVQLERALAENKTLKDQVTALSAQARTASISSLIKDKGLNPKIAKLIPADVESTQEALDKWFEENADLFPATPKEQSGGDDQEQESDEDQEYAQQLNAMGNVTGSSATPQRDRDLLAQMRSPELTQEKLLEMINAAGGGVGSG